MPRRAGESGTMIDRIGRAIAAAENSDKARYRRLAAASLKPLTRSSETMVDAAYQLSGLTTNSRRDFKKAVKTMIIFAMRECDG